MFLKFKPSKKKPIKINFFSPVKLNTLKSVKKVPLRNLTWPQASLRFPRMNPFADKDRDGKLNMFDCRPFDVSRHGRSPIYRAQRRFERERDREEKRKRSIREIYIYTQSVPDKVMFGDDGIGGCRMKLDGKYHAQINPKEQKKIEKEFDKSKYSYGKAHLHQITVDKKGIKYEKEGGLLYETMTHDPEGKKVKVLIDKEIEMKYPGTAKRIEKKFKHHKDISDKLIKEYNEKYNTNYPGNEKPIHPTRLKAIYPRSVHGKVQIYKRELTSTPETLQSLDTNDNQIPDTAENVNIERIEHEDED